jgi:hypothetical protein
MFQSNAFIYPPQMPIEVTLSILELGRAEFSLTYNFNPMALSLYG